MMDNNYDKYAKELLDLIKTCVTEETKDYVKVKSAIVDSVNLDNTVNIRFPESEGIWSNITNQSIYQNLVPGDEVKIIQQNGIGKICWIIGVLNPKNKKIYNK